MADARIRLKGRKGGRRSGPAAEAIVPTRGVTMNTGGVCGE